MQPNIFMWCGLLKSLIDSDLHIIRDDVKSSRNSRFNRNKIAGNGTETWLTIPFIKFNDHKLIFEQRLSTNDIVRKKLTSLFKGRYASYPYCSRSLEIINYSLQVGADEGNLIDIYIRFLDALRNIGLPICKTVLASSLIKESEKYSFSGVDMVNNLLNKSNADCYYAAQNTINYAERSEYRVKKVLIQEFSQKSYYQIGLKTEEKNFIKNLSCLDIIASLPVEEIKENLDISNNWK